MRDPASASPSDIAVSHVERAVADRRFGLFGNLVLALAVVGYPLSAAISQIVETDTSEINIAFRVISLMLAVLLGLWSIGRGQYRLDVLVMVFLMIYTIRMVWDFAYSGLPHIQDDFQFYVATTLAPTLALGAGSVWYDEKTCARWIAVIGGFAGLLIAYTLIYQPDIALLEQLNDRASFKFLNAISISYHGFYIAAAALILSANRSERRTILIWGAIAALGGYLMVAGGSRGPFVALVLAVGITALANTRTVGAYAVLGIVIAVLLVAIGAPELIVQRFMSVGEDTSSLERFYAMQLSIEAAIEHPVLGYAYIEPITGFYPHNLLIEAAMALGLIGAALMLLMQVALVAAAWRLARRGEWLLPLLAMAAFANAWISGSLWGSGLFFAILWIAHGRVRMLNSVSRQWREPHDRVREQPPIARPLRGA